MESFADSAGFAAATGPRVGSVAAWWLREPVARHCSYPGSMWNCLNWYQLWSKCWHFRSRSGSSPKRPLLMCLSLYLLHPFRPCRYERNPRSRSKSLRSMQISSCFNSLFCAREPGRSFVPRFSRFTCTVEKSLVLPITQWSEGWLFGFHAFQRWAFSLPQRSALRFAPMIGLYGSDSAAREARYNSRKSAVIPCSSQVRMASVRGNSKRCRPA